MQSKEGAEISAEHFRDRLNKLRQLLANDAGNQALRRQCIQVATLAGDFDYVQALSDEVLARQPDDQLGLFDRATALIGKREYSGALEVMARLPQDQPAVLQNQALCSYCLGRYAESTALLERLYAAGHRDGGVLRLIVSGLHHLGKVDEAVAIADDNQAAAELDGALAGAYALLYLDADDSAKASRWATICLKLNPASIDGRVTQATLLTARVQTGRARELLDSVVRDSPAVGRAWLGLGALDLLDRNLEAAKVKLVRGLELMPNHVGSWHVLAWTQMVSGDLAAAESNFQRAMDLDRNFAETHGGLASIAAIRGERARAEHLIEVALKLDAHCLSARFAQAVLQGKTGDPEQAQRIIQDAIGELSSRDSSALSKLLTRSTRH